MYNHLKATIVGLFLLLTFSASAVSAQTVTSPGPTDASLPGFMFDIQAVNPITITTVVSEVQAGSTYTLYSRPSTYVGNDTSSAGWTILGTASPGGVGNVNITFNVSLALAANQTAALYIVRTSGGGNARYKSAGSSGSVLASDPNLVIRVGQATGALFSFFVPDRGLVGSITYAPTVYEVPTLSEWAMILLVLSLAGVGIVMVRRRAA